MKTALISHPDCLAHAGTAGYQEVPQRLSVVLSALADLDLLELDAPLATREDLLRVHSEAHIDRILQTVAPGQTIDLDDDTALDCFTADAALRAAGAVCSAVDGVMNKDYTKAFCAVRPPGHHAEPEQAMGFCYFSAIAIAALRAKQVYGLARIAVVDFDVHHGNGTQTALSNIPGMYFASIHQHPHYPGTGAEVDHPNIRNIPMPAGTSAEDWRTAFSDKIIQDLQAFRPEIILVSAGFDAHKDDPLGEFNLTEQDYAWLGVSLSETAEKYSNDRLVSVLEGGYNLRALAKSARTYVEAL
ncbi:MAG: acetoin utilization protein [Robiginitomaculum sp.]|nr:MAG: acetoin utilization protein [Robiginitomaculum sp.]